MWKDSYLVGVEIIDKQHKQLFEYVNELAQTLKVEFEFDEHKNRITQALRYLKKYCIDHFRDEEAYHEEINYADRLEHKKLHIKLIQDLISNEKEIIESNFSPASVKKFLGFVLTWLVYHVAGEDQKLKGLKPETVLTGLNIGSVQDFAQRVKKVLRTVTGLADEEVSFEVTQKHHIIDGVGFTVGLIGGGDKKGVALSYSKTIAIGALKAMTRMEVDEVNEIAHSALQEISNIVSSRIAEAISEKGTFCDIEYPVSTSPANFPSGKDRFLMRTSIGDMEVMVY